MCLERNLQRLTMQDKRRKDKRTSVATSSWASQPASSPTMVEANIQVVITS